MPRKRSVAGRAKRVTEESKLRLQAEKITRRFRSLERGRNFGVYTGKSLLEFASRNPFVSIKKARGSKRHRVLLGRLKQATEGQLAKIATVFSHALKAKTFSNIGIENTRTETRKKIKETLSGIAGRTLTNRDVDLFFEVIKHQSDIILNKIKPSDFMAIVFEAQDNNYDVEGWIDKLEQVITIGNNDYMRKSAEYLYYKYVK